MVQRLLFFLVVLCPNLSFGQYPEYVFEQITSEAGITFNAVSSIVEDKYGFIWFGTADGLYYYNSVEVIKYSNTTNLAASLPSNHITGLYRDSSGRIWISTNQGICYFDECNNAFVSLPPPGTPTQEGEFYVGSLTEIEPQEFLVAVNGRLYGFDDNDPVLRTVTEAEHISQVQYLGKLSDGNIYVGTANGELFVRKGENLNYVPLFRAPSKILTVNQFNGELWLGTSQDGVYVLNETGKQLYHYTTENYLPYDWVRTIIQRKDDEVWVGTTKGIAVIDRSQDSLKTHRITNGLPHTGVFKLLVDGHNGVWIGTWAGGLAYYQEQNFKFPHIRSPLSPLTSTRSVVSSFAENSDGNIWVGIENSTLKKYIPGQLTYAPGEQGENWQSVGRVKTMASGKNGRIWLGTLYNGLWLFDKGVFTQQAALSVVFSSVCETEEGLWIGTRTKGLIFYDLVSSTYEYLGDQGALRSNDGIWHVFEDSRNDLWVATGAGLRVKRAGTELFENVIPTNGSSVSSSSAVYTITETNDGKLWIGTAGTGIAIYDPALKEIVDFSQNAVIASAEVYSILPDLEDNIWFSTNQGIYAYYPATDQLRNFTVQDGILGKQYHPNSGFINTVGTLFFGGGNGFNVIDPTTVKHNDEAPDVYLAQVQIDNVPLNESPGEVADAKFFPRIKEINLKHHQNSIAFHLAANNFIKPVKNTFRYRMKGYLDDWVFATHAENISFNKIPYGNYVLELQACNNDGVCSRQIRTVEINVAPPFWLSWYAWVAYGLFTILGFLGLLYALRFRDQSNAERKLFSEKIKFFTNVSHELRTPLTLVVSPLQNLLDKHQYDPKTTENLQIIKRNADRLQRMTNSILDLRLIELNKVKLKRSPTDLIDLCHKVYSYFEYDAKVKRLNLVFTSSFRSLHLPLGIDKAETVIYNLIANAIKHSPDGAELTMSVKLQILSLNDYRNTFFTGHKFTGKTVQITVEDQGKGIPEKNLDHIFNRFFVDGEQEKTGLGIGLHICQEYVKMHQGNIMVDTTEGVGTTFRVNLPFTLASAKKSDIAVQYQFDGGRFQAPEDRSALPAGAPKKLILYVEDNDELRRYFKKLLAQRYKVLTAKNGIQAFTISQETTPDLIIADVLMPGMTGLELTRKLKENPATNSIPVVLLTALSDEKHKIESMATGVHTFLTKPVAESFLFAKIDNILLNRAKLIRSIEQFNDHAHQNGKDAFSVTARKLVELNLSNPNFSIEEFAEQLNISRSSLQRSLKKSLNQSPTEFIRDIRLKKAIDLMKDGSYNISEIAVLVGFNSTSYFIRTFKKQYGKTPYAFQSDIALKD